MSTFLNDNYTACINVYLVQNGMTNLSPYISYPDYYIVYTDNNLVNSIAAWTAPNNIPQPTNDQLSAITANQITTQQISYLIAQYNLTGGNLRATDPKFALAWQGFYQLMTGPYLPTPLTNQQFATFCQGVWTAWANAQPPPPS